MHENLGGHELVTLLERVFHPREPDRRLAVLVDLPDEALPDTPRWRERRELAAGWVAALRSQPAAGGVPVSLVLYRNARTNNADLPETAWVHEAEALPAVADALDAAAARPFSEILGEQTVILAPTQLSATAPLKLWARRLGFRAATMPGFSREMIPALRLDYREIDRRVRALTGLLDRATLATLRFRVDDAAEHELRLDLRHRQGHASGGLFPEAGTAGNLPSGEAYIVPYEGEHPGDPTASQGELPVQLGDDVVVYEIRDNRAVRVSGESATAQAEAQHLAEDPAYGNLAELGLGVLGAFGIKPMGEILLDEKLGLHVAFGRSDHFGGQIGPAAFARPDTVVHIDRVYIPELQPRVAVLTVDLTLEGNETVPLMRNGDYVAELG